MSGILHHEKKRKRLIESDLYYQNNVGIERILRI